MKHLLPLLFCLTLVACGSKKDDPKTPQARLLRTWNLQTTRDQITYPSGIRPDFDGTFTYQNASVTFAADGKITGVNTGPAIGPGTYTFDGKTLLMVVGGFKEPPAQVLELTDTKLVFVATETASNYVHVETTTATR
ncbi:hypothetical protein [Hymenobacter arizonensis]|uniref:Lipocalin-like domain-containing protein n=1 Tax=Hymenobacter arizonensis TaxID=1227077 RepID=A0A1I6BL42_HYMAR|nr:hypothetical protein [Hymenobacter arizonensis]SFQ81646.1 hypothetical protein SAMN04515668_4706 [Hymenobacter arizonensis]